MIWFFFSTVDELMSLAVRAVPSSSNMGFDDNKESATEDKSGTLEKKATLPQESDDEEGSRIGSRQMSESSFYATEDDDNDDENSNTLQLGPQCTLKEQLEKDKVINLFSTILVIWIEFSLSFLLLLFYVGGDRCVSVG